MGNKFRIFVVFICSLFILFGCQPDGSSQVDENSETDESSQVNEPTTTKDDQETEDVEGKEEENHRIVATTVAITEIMEKLELDLVGVPTSYKGLPGRYVDATEIGNPMWPDMEILMSLDPTDVLSVTTLKEDLETDFEKVDVPASFLDLQSFSSMLTEIEKLGEEYHRTEQAEQLINRLEERMVEIEEKVADKESPTVLILMGIPGSYIVGTEHSYIGDLVNRAGGVNAVTDRDEEYISANTEYLQQLNPDIILRAAHGAPEEVVKMFDQEFTENDIWKHFTAVQNDRVYDLEETLFGTTANLDAIEALEELITILYEN